MSTTDEAARIRAAYKAKGWNSRMIGVRAEHFSMGSSIHVTIKDAAVSTAEARAIAESAESIRRCEITGEILSGGNRYVHVRHSNACIAVLARRHIDAVDAAIARLDKADPTRMECVDGTEGRALVAFESGRHDIVRFWIDDQPSVSWHLTAGGNESAAFHLAVALETAPEAR
jgi:hypothetical protein